MSHVKADTIAANKIEVVKDLIPASLRRGGVNPLAVLHEALSSGIHELDDETCLDSAVMIRESLERLLDVVRVEQDQGDTYSHHMHTIKARLGKKARQLPSS